MLAPDDEARSSRHARRTARPRVDGGPALNTPIFPVLAAALGSIAVGIVLGRRGDVLNRALPWRTCVVVVMSLVLGYYLAHHWHTFEGGLHVGFYANAAWNVVQGDPYRQDWFGSVLGYHALFSGIWLSLPALAFDHPWAFTALHLVYTALGAPSYAALARHLTRRNDVAIAVGVLFLLNPYVTGWFWNPFTVYAPVFALLPLAFLAAEHGRRHLAGLLALAAGLLLEDIALGLLLYWGAERILARDRHADRRLPGWFGYAQGGVLALYFLVLKPHLPAVGSEGQHLAPALASGDLGALLERGKIGFLAHTVLGTAGLCLLAPFPLLITAADVGLALVSPTLEVHLINSPYLPALGAGILLSGVYGLDRLLRVLPSLERYAAPALLCWALALPAAYTHSPYAAGLWKTGGPENAGIPHSALAVVPVGAEVATNDSVFYGWAYDRRVVFLDDLFFTWLATSSRSRAREAEWIVLDRARKNSGCRDLEELLARGEHILVREDGTRVVARRRMPGPP